MVQGEAGLAGVFGWVCLLPCDGVGVGLVVATPSLSAVVLWIAALGEHGAQTLA